MDLKMELQIEHLYKSYRTKAALQDVSFTLHQGTYGLLGENGQEGKVWETIISREIYHQLRKERSIIHLKQMGNDVQVRYVGDEYSGVDNSEVEPNLEDYYVFAGGILEESEE